MLNSPDQFIISYRQGVEDRVRAQIARHARVDPTGSRRQIVDLQIGQEREALQRIITKNEDNSVMVDFCEALIAWLPELAQQIKQR